eukprot:scaffold67453_cov76-Cyclotella_meneghiniana.AAC.1
MSGYKFGIWLGSNPLFAPRLSEFGLIRAIHSISTLPIIHHSYTKWLDTVEIGINPPQPSPHPDFRVTTGGENFGWDPYVPHQD